MGEDSFLERVTLEGANSIGSAPAAVPLSDVPIPVSGPTKGVQCPR
jgi:hypothetical protein